MVVEGDGEQYSHRQVIRDGDEAEKRWRRGGDDEVGERRDKELLGNGGI